MDFNSDLFSNFDPIGLSEMDQVNFMTRIDNKYVFDVSLLPNILDQVKDDYYVLEIKEERLMDYSTLYYDTEDLQLYKNHHNGHLNRYKVRSRTYMNTNTSFFEIKFKNNKKKTIKSRIKIDEISHSIKGSEADFVKEVAGINGEELRPILWVDYKRATLVSKAMNERSTIDLALTVYEVNGEKKILSEIAIIEAKRDKLTKHTPMIRTLRKNGIRANGFSKYCLGLAKVRDGLKKNSFKKKILTVNKIKKEYNGRD